jgi:hypothetical protein
VRTISTKDLEIKSVSTLTLFDLVELTKLASKTEHPEVLKAIIEKEKGPHFFSSQHNRVLLAIASNRCATEPILNELIGLGNANEEVLKLVAAHENATPQIEAKILFLNMITTYRNHQLHFDTLLAIAKNQNTDDATLEEMTHAVGKGPMAANRSPELLEAIVTNPNAQEKTLLRAAFTAAILIRGHKPEELEKFWSSLVEAKGASKELLVAIPSWATSDKARSAIERRLRKLS